MNDILWDPLRKKHVKTTPEEVVRQWFIQQLKDRMQVPQHMMMSEVGLNIGQKTLRADILVYARGLKPLIIVECKRPSVALDQKVLEQAITYNLVLDVKYIIITNGKHTYICRKNDNAQEPYTFLSEVPTYEQMINNADEIC